VQGDIDDENSRYAILSLKGEELERFKNNAMDIVRG